MVNEILSTLYALLNDEEKQKLRELIDASTEVEKCLEEVKND